MIRIQLLTVAVICLGSLCGPGRVGQASAFLPSVSFPSKVSTLPMPTMSSTFSTQSKVPPTAQSSDEVAVDLRSFTLSREEVKPIIKVGSGDKEKIVNAFGLWALVISILTGPPWMLAMKLVQRLENDKNRELFDMMGKIWAKTWLTLTNSYPTVSVRSYFLFSSFGCRATDFCEFFAQTHALLQGNLMRMEKENHLGPCLFVANHASWREC